MGNKFSIKILLVAAFAAAFLFSGVNPVQAKSLVCKKYDNYRTKYKNADNKKAYLKTRWLRGHEKEAYRWYKAVYDENKELPAAELDKLSPEIKNIFLQFRGFKRYKQYLTYRKECHEDNDEQSSEKQILTFSLPYPDSGGAQEDLDIDQTNHTITSISLWSSPSNLAPVITVSPGAAVSPVSGVATDFDDPVTYTVTAEDGSTQDYEVTILFAT